MKEAIVNTDSVCTSTNVEVILIFYDFEWRHKFINFCGKTERMQFVTEVIQFLC
jgi:hypothetical protein